MGYSECNGKRRRSYLHDESYVVKLKVNGEIFDFLQICCVYSQGRLIESLIVASSYCYYSSLVLASAIFRHR